MASGSVDGDKVTITALNESAYAGCILAQYDLANAPGYDQITFPINHISISYTSTASAELGITDAGLSDVTAEQGGNSVTIDMVYDYESLENVLLYLANNNNVPIEFTITGITGSYVEPQPTEDFWTINDTSVTTATQSDGNYLQIQALTSIGEQTGSILATHTVDVTPGSETLTLTYNNDGTAVNNAISFQFYDPDAAIQNYGTFTPSSDAASSTYTLTWSNYVETLPEHLEIRCVTNPLTVANLPVAFTLTVGQN